MEENIQRGHEREKNMSRDEYLTDAYFSLPQLWSFAEQIFHLRHLKPKSIIEIGMGNGFVSQFMRTTNVKVLTCDINPDLKPDLLISVTDLDKHVQSGEYDLVSCCEVLEHLPFDQFEPTIKTFADVSDDLFLTLPVSGRIIGIGGLFIKSWGRRWFSYWKHIPSARYTPPSMHFWEVEWSKENKTKALVKILKKHYANVETNIFKMNPYHRYFTCTGSIARGSKK